MYGFLTVLVPRFLGYSPAAGLLYPGWHIVLEGVYEGKIDVKN